MNTSINQDANAVANFQRRGIYNKYQQEKNSIQETDLQASFFLFLFSLKTIVIISTLASVIVMHKILPYGLNG